MTGFLIRAIFPLLIAEDFIVKQSSQNIVEMGRTPNVVTGQHIVVFDGLNETEEVLKAVLEPQGCRVNRLRKQNTNEVSNYQKTPSIIIMHDDDSSDSTTNQLGWNEVPKVVIGSVKASKPVDTSVSTRFLVQPFQYAELIDSIESLLSQPPSTH